MWESLLLRNQRAVLVSLFRELRWDGVAGSLAFVLDEEGITSWLDWGGAHEANARS
jgi:hypothetical protein